MKARSGRAQRRAIERDIKKGKRINSMSDEEVLYRLKYGMNEIQADQLIATLKPEQYDYILGNPLPTSFAELRATGKTFSTDEIEKELVWYQRIVTKYSNEINQFLLLKQEFENAFLLGEYDRAQEQLDLIEQEVCVSHWGLEKQLLVSEFKAGFKKNKEKLASLISAQNNDITNILGQYQSIRVERNISQYKYDDMVEKYLDLYDREELKEYLGFKLNFFTKYYYEYSGFLLFYENNASIIDRYLIFRAVLLQEFSKSNTKLNITRLKTLCEKLYEIIDDKSLANIAIGLGGTPTVQLSPENITFIQCLDNYTEGSYSKCVEQCKDLLIKNPTLFELYETLIKACGYSQEGLDEVFPEGSLAHQTLSGLRKLYLKEDDFATTWNSLLKTVSSVGSNEWTNKLFGILQHEFSRYHPGFKMERYALCFSNYFNPISSVSFEDKSNSISFLETLKSEVPNSKTVRFWLEINEAISSKVDELKSQEINDFRRKFYQARVYQGKSKFDQCLNVIDEIIKKKEAELTFNRLDLFHMKIGCLLGKGDYKSAVVFVVSVLLENPAFRFRLNNDLLVEAYKANHEDLTREISMPILIHHLIDIREDLGNNDLWIAYDNFLSSHGLDFANELVNELSADNKTHVVYFLRHIAKQGVYYNSYMFETQEALDNERIDICLKLIDLDPENVKEYQDEISEISRDLLIRKGIKQIDESKIFVDVKGIKKSLEVDLKETFLRSINLLNLSIDEISKLDTNSENLLIPFYSKKTDSTETVDTDNIRLTSYSRFTQFKEMFLKIRDKFIASNEFGIDTSLSMRIRHGTLLGETRSVYEKYQLITKKVSENGGYQNNDYWLNQMELSDDSKEKFNKLLAIFSSNVDKYADELKNKWLQVRTETRSTEGLFDYSYLDKELHSLFTNSFGSIEKFDEFYEDVIQELWDRTEVRLEETRDFVSGEIKKRNIDLLEKFSSDLEQLIDKSEHPGINELIKNITSCKTGVDVEFDNIARWFKRTNNRTINDFKLELPIDASLRTVKRLYPEFSSFEPVIEIKCDSIFEGEHFTPFTLLFQNLFENIIKHSGNPQENLKVSLKGQTNGKRLQLIIENSLSESIDLDARNAKILKTRELLTKEIGELTRSEGGTGYPKMKKIIHIDLKQDDFNIDISDLDTSRNFMTALEFNFRDLIKKKENESSSN